jgi:hypothetical protein
MLMPGWQQATSGLYLVTEFPVGMPNFIFSYGHICALSLKMNFCSSVLLPQEQADMLALSLALAR